MTIHLTKFIDRVVGHEARGNKDFVMSMADAKNMHADLTRLLLELETLRLQITQHQTEQVLEVKIGGGSF